jgi:integrase
MTAWLAGAVPHLAPQTAQDYTYRMNRLLIPLFGDQKLRDLTPSLVERGLREIARDHGVRTGQYCRMIFRQVMQNAVRDRLIPANPVIGVKLPKAAAPVFHVIAKADLPQFHRAIAGEVWEAYFLLLLYTGLRPSEGLALQWPDWDCVNHRLSITRTLTQVNGRWVPKEPKTKGSRRSVPIPQILTDVLTAHYAQWVAKGFETPWMFPNRHGLAADRKNIMHRHFKPILKDAGLPAEFRLYDLRHTHATLLLGAGVHPSIVAERLGHASVTMTLERYSHVLPTMQDAAIAALEGLGDAKIDRKG